jgi:signal transduction histidine kinase
MRDELEQGRAFWAYLGGLSLEQPNNHSLLQGLFRRMGLGIGGMAFTGPPSRVVLDWSRVERMSAEGFAQFAVMVGTLLDGGCQVTILSPAWSDLQQALAELGLCSWPPTVSWVECDVVPTSRIQALVPAAIFGGPLGRGNIGEFLDGLSRELRRLNASKQPAELLEAAAIELTQNSHAYATGARVVVVALMEHRRRPRRIQIGLADAGPGISNHLLQRLEHERLAPFTDFTVVETVLAHALTGRVGGHGGGFSRLAERITKQHEGSVWVRSGEGLVRFGEGGGGRMSGVRLGAGFGTQVRVTLPIQG